MKPKKRGPRPRHRPRPSTNAPRSSQAKPEDKIGPASDGGAGIAAIPAPSDGYRKAREALERISSGRDAADWFVVIEEGLGDARTEAFAKAPRRAV